MYKWKQVFSVVYCSENQGNLDGHSSPVAYKQGIRGEINPASVNLEWNKSSTLAVHASPFEWVWRNRMTCFSTCRTSQSFCWVCQSPRKMSRPMFIYVGAYFIYIVFTEWFSLIRSRQFSCFLASIYIWESFELCMPCSTNKNAHIQCNSGPNKLCFDKHSFC